MDNNYLDYLEHHGIKGQRWGIRRYQNEDGTLTPSGKARYNDDGTRKNPKKMTDKELEEANRRLSAENNYNMNVGKGYKNAFNTNTLVKAGASAVGGFLAVSGGMLARDLIKNGQFGKAEILKAAKYGLLSAGVGALTSAVTSLGGSIKNEKKEKG